MCVVLQIYIVFTREAPNKAVKKKEKRERVDSTLSSPKKVESFAYCIHSRWNLLTTHLADTQSWAHEWLSLFLKFIPIFSENGTII